MWAHCLPNRNRASVRDESKREDWGGGRQHPPRGKSMLTPTASYRASGNGPYRVTGASSLRFPVLSLRL